MIQASHPEGIAETTYGVVESDDSCEIWAEDSSIFQRRVG